MDSEVAKLVAGRDALAVIEDSKPYAEVRIFWGKITFSPFKITSIHSRKYKESSSLFEEIL